MHALKAAGVLAIASIFMAGCVCDKIKDGDFDEAFARLKRECDCKFTVTCGKLENGILGVTVTGPDGVPLITIDEDVTDEDVLKHELIHAVDKYKAFSRQQVPRIFVGVDAAFWRRISDPSSDIRCFELIVTYFEIVTTEYIAESKFGTDDDVDVSGRFDDADDEDQAILYGFSIAESNRARFEPEDQQKLAGLIEEVGLVPGELGDDNSAYQRLKEQLRLARVRFNNELGDCCELIDELID